MSDTASKRRYALYYTPPPSHPLTRAAVAWLGRDAFGADDAATTRGPEHDNELAAEPRRYGFHATIKAPFRLRDGYSRNDLEAALLCFTSNRASCPVGPLRVAMLGEFFALVPRGATPFLNILASQAVSEFDRFRAAMNPQELRRRMRADLDEKEMTHLVQWGYPYVFDRFRFHMTLTGQVSPALRDQVRDRLEALFDPLLHEDFHINALTLYVQEHPGEDFFAATQFRFRVSQHERATG